MENSIPTFSVSRLKFLRQSLNLLGGSGRFLIFLEVRIAQMSIR